MLALLKSTKPKAEMEKDINSEWEAIAKYKEKVFSSSFYPVQWVVFFQYPHNHKILWKPIVDWEKVLSPDLSKAAAHSCVVTAAGGWRLNKWASSLPIKKYVHFSTFESPYSPFHIFYKITKFSPSYNCCFDQTFTKGSLNWEIFSTGTSHLASSELRCCLF